VRTHPARCAAILVLSFALAFAPARRAEARDGLEEIIIAIIVVPIVVGGVVTLAVGIPFTVHDSTLARKGSPPDHTWAITETALTTPLALLYGVGVGASQADETPSTGLTTIFYVGGAWMGALSTHGIWSASSDKVNPVAQFGVSWAVGANLMLTTAAISAAAKKRLSGVGFGAVEMASTAPSIATGIYKLADSSQTEKASWGALTAWSGVLFAHGAASFVVGLVEKPPPPAEPSQEARLPFTLAPILVGTGPLSAPGIAAIGAF
jgi:hypothetical protein